DVHVQSGRAALLPFVSIDVALVAARLLSRSGDREGRTALALALCHEEAERIVPTETLLSLIDDKSPAAPFAARALAARDEERTRTTIDALVESADPAIRFHSVLGLGRSPMPDASGRLAAAYRFEADSSVRWAIVSALSRHTE